MVCGSPVGVRRVDDVRLFFGCDCVACGAETRSGDERIVCVNVYGKSHTALTIFFTTSCTEKRSQKNLFHRKLCSYISVLLLFVFFRFAI